MAGYLATAYVHLLAAIIWVGGMVFLSLVLMPAALGMELARRGALVSAVGRRFRWVGWGCILVLVVTGLLLLDHRGISLTDLFTGGFIAGPRGGVLLWKLALFAAMVLLSALHDFVLGPQATRALQTSPQAAARLRRRTAWLARANLALALAILVMAILLVRG